MTAQPAEGDTAPDFALPDGAQGTVSLADLAGKPVVVYFYPKDDTSGCTVEAKDFSAAKPEFDALGVTVIGISPDDAKSHAKFQAKHGLSIALGADPERQAIEAYGVWAEKSMYGKTYMGVERSTFLIDASGRIARVWRKVKVPGHVAEVLAAARAL
ncbi:thioredoxin-dependent thiol peroxidase [Methylobrevis albus]|uniref:thioredoxin-dependent peroxiredoxin n=1 Tax=Methylobrevis albus TaxID=2793297 RepID=A0A931I2V0_9HYPH|nr:thioredoxin-dependent thiol peroxidase [Methylobrevis albus]MBH0239220.1 thioredoxin-dependent thiol peroxidase [Methylobrevis albus]